MFTFRELTRADFPLLHEWLHRPHVAEWWTTPPPSLAEVEEEYSGDLASPAIFPHLACLEGRPVGFIQWYDVMNADPDWWKDETDPGARGIDQYLADEAMLGRGLGTRMVAEFVAQIFGDPAVTKVQTDPDPRNPRAVRCYEKVGFRAIRELTTPDGPSLLMVVRRDEFKLTGDASTRPAQRRP